MPLVMSQRALTPQRFPELCFHARRLFFFFFFVCGRNTWLLSGEFIDTLETPSVGILRGTGPLMSGRTSQLKCLRTFTVLSGAVSDVVQVEVIRTYTAKQPDELSLQVADVVLVSQTVEDGTSHSSAPYYKKKIVKSLHKCSE